MWIELKLFPFGLPECFVAGSGAILLLRFGDRDFGRERCGERPRPRTGDCFEEADDLEGSPSALSNEPLQLWQSHSCTFDTLKSPMLPGGRGLKFETVDKGNDAVLLAV